MTGESIIDKKLSRRQFVGTAAAGAAAIGAVAGATAFVPGAAAAPLPAVSGKAGGPAAKRAQPMAIPSSWDGVADVIVVGLGGAGAAAALNAAATGLQVLVLEKMATPGGSSGIAAGAFAAAGSVLQTSKGIVDTPGKFFDFYTKAGMGTTDPDTLLSYCENSAAGWQWLANVCATQAGVSNPASLWGGLSFSGSSYVVPSDVIPRFSIFSGYPGASIPSGGAGEFYCGYKAIQATPNIQVMLSAPAVGLITNNDGEVAGVQALVNDTLSNFQAKRAVILTTGSFARNDEMSHTICPFVYYGFKLSSLGNTGDGIILGQQVGAALSGAFGAMSHPRTTAPSPTQIQNSGGSWGTNGMASQLNGELATTSIIFVNNRGQRFVNESTMSIPNSQLVAPYIPSGWTSYYAGLQIFNQDQHQAWALFDNAVASKGGSTIVSYFSKDLSTEIAGGYVLTAATIPALATAMGVNPTALSNTVNLWNADAANNTDTLYGRPNNFFQLSTPPYFAMVLGWTCDDAWGGLKINGNTQVLDPHGNPIPRLYAAGATTGGIVGPFYQSSGGAVGSAWTMGMVAGKHARTLVPWA